MWPFPNKQLPVWRKNRLFSLKGLLTLQSPSHTIRRRSEKRKKNQKESKRNQKDPPASRDPDFEGNFKFINRENRLFASRVYSASCHGQLCTFSTGKTLKCQLERWSRTFRRYQQQKQHEFRGVSQLIPWVKPVFSAVFLTLLHDRVAEMPRKWLGRHLSGHDRLSWGCTTVCSGGLCYLLAAPPWTVLRLSFPWFRNAHPMWQRAGCCSW